MGGALITGPEMTFVTLQGAPIDVSAYGILYLIALIGPSIAGALVGAPLCCFTNAIIAALIPDARTPIHFRPTTVLVVLGATVGYIASVTMSKTLTLASGMPNYNALVFDTYHVPGTSYEFFYAGLQPTIVLCTLAAMLTGALALPATKQEP